MKPLSLLLLFTIGGCSLIEKRKEHYDYLRPGLSKKQIIRRSGSPKRRLLSTRLKDVYIYNYCDVSYLQELIGGIFTLGLYNLHCGFQDIHLQLTFKHNRLIEIKDDVNAAARERRQARRDRGLRNFQQVLQKTSDSVQKNDAAILDSFNKKSDKK